MRIGHGYDVHKLIAGRKLIIGGIEIPYEKGLLGHSDADVLTHAICDALLGAAKLPDIGNLFPDNSSLYKDINSLLLLKEVILKLKDKNYNIVNIDCTIIAQSPKMAPYLNKMCQKIADTCKIDTENINIKATTEEYLGFTGKGQGIAAHSVCLIE